MTDVSFHPPPVQLQALREALDHTRLQHDLERLCAADFAGRRIGTDGHERAADWLYTTMDALGLAVKRCDFILEHPVLDLHGALMLAILEADGAVRQFLAHRRDFAEHPASADCSQLVSGPVHCWRDESVPHGAWVMLDQPVAYDSLHTLGTQLAEQGALGILLPQHPTSEGYLSKRVAAASPIALPVITVRSDLLPTLEGEYLQAVLPLQRLLAQGALTLGEIAGSDSTLATAPLIVGAHYDGVGDDPGGSRIPGAADNAAGVAVVLELARVIQQSVERPRRTIIFAAFDAEEVQAQGSRAYAHQLLKQGSMPFVINLDGAARLNEAVWVEVSTNAEILIAALDQAGQWLEIPLILGQVASDNRRYASAGFPAVGVALGGSGGHTPLDTPAYVDHLAMKTAAELLLATLWHLAF